MKWKLTILLAAALFLVGCGTEIDKPLVTKPVEVDSPPIQEPYPVSFEKEVFEAAPQTVASLSPALTEILWDFCPEKVVGVSDYCDYPAETAGLQTLGSPAEPDIDAIIELKPELLLISSPLASVDALKIKQEGIRVLRLKPPTTFAQLCEIYIKIAMIFDGSVEFEESATMALSGLEASVQSAMSLPKHTFVVVEGETKGGLLLSPGNTLASDMFSLYGENLWAASERYTATDDELFVLAPEVVFYSDKLKERDIEKVFPHSTLIGIDFERFERPTSRISVILDFCTNRLS